MQRQPSVVIIARHGARLDQGDKDWQTTADKPWDPPLNYGGFLQSQSLGSRIASELEDLDRQGIVDGHAEDGPGPRKRRKVIIHSSPYLRCVQTSIGIAAGLRHPQESPFRRPIIAPLQRSSLSKPPILPDEDSLSPTTTHESVTKQQEHHVDDDQQEKTELKIDAFLGEWLSSGYFNKIKAPPSSDILVTAAKDGLQVPPEEIRGADLARTSIHEFPDLELDGDDEAAEMPAIEKLNLHSLRSSGPARSRTLSFGKSLVHDAVTDLRHHRRARSSTYSPPVPLYSIAPKDTIPAGFVAHAREACIHTDLQWDSQKSPLSWGDGGEYEEEWSVMHRRFRDGLQNMLSYYATLPACSRSDESNEEDEDVVLVLVTHQAGCNALIRLVTGAPALYDIGTASLTMAVRKPPSESRRNSSVDFSMSPSRPRRGSLDLGLGDEYDMKIIASTEHLRVGSNPLGLNSPHLAASPAFATRRMAGPESAEGFSIGDSLGWRSNSHQGVTRSSSLKSHFRDSTSSMASMAGSGLWGERSRASSLSTDSSVEVKMGVARKGTTSIIPEDEEVIEEPIEKRPGTASSTAEQWTHRSGQPVRSESTKGVIMNGLWGGPPKSNGDGLWSSPRSSSGTFNRESSPTLSNERRAGMRRWTAAGS